MWVTLEELCMCIFPFKGKNLMDDRKCFGSVTDYCRIISNECELISAFVNSLNSISV